MLTANVYFLMPSRNNGESAVMCTTIVTTFVNQIHCKNLEMVTGQAEANRKLINVQDANKN